MPDLFWLWVNVDRLYTKKLVKCADPRDRKVKRLLKKLRQRAKAHKSMQVLPQRHLPVMSTVSYLHHFIPTKEEPDFTFYFFSSSYSLLNC